MRPLFVAEPPASYAARPPIVCDCSVISAILFAEAERELAVQHLAGRAPHAPTLLDHEVANVALKKRARGLDTQAVHDALSAYAQQAIVLHRVDIAQQCGLAERYSLSAYDAAYLWLAARLQAPLATFDRKLGTAAQVHLTQSP